MLNAFSLGNDIRVATYQMRSLRSIHLRIDVKGGSVLEYNGKIGLAHFLEHMLIQGIPSLPNAEAMSEYIERLAGSYNASTGEFSINFFITVPKTHLEDAVKIASEVFFEPLFPEVAIEKERRAILEEIRQRMDSPEYKIGKFVRETRFIKGCPLLNPVAGTVADVEKITKADLVAFWEKLFVPKNTYISITGSFEEDELNRYLKQYLGEYHNSTFAKIPNFNQKNLSGKKVGIRFDSNLKSNYIDLSFPSLSLENSLALRLRQNIILAILVNLSRSRMFRLLRYQRGLVYGVNAGSLIADGLGYTAIASEASRENLEEVVMLIVQELATFIKNGPTEEELAVTKEFLSNQWLMSFDHPSSIANWIEGDLLWEDKIHLPEEMIELIQNTTSENLIDLMQKHWDFKKVNLVIQGGIKNTPENTKKYSGILAKLS
ncbi:MAG: insulinase family protein [Candidatus Blackburnbacteria bacterium]|nr:insulinase family protein [Candidatus Blackburnbacteria bacterium]